MGRSDSLSGPGFSSRVRSAVLTTILLLAGCSAEGQGTGAEHEQAAVDVYVAAINNRDADALARAAPPGNDAEEEIDSLLAKQGGKALSVESVRFTRDFGPDHAVAHVVGEFGDGTGYDERLTLTRIEGRWYVALGESRMSDKTPASTLRPQG